MTIVISIIVVLIILGILSAAHELGHFFAARSLKVKAFEVSIFVGPTLFKWRKKDVDYSIRSIPVGAYVRFNDIDNEGNPIVNDDPDLLVNQPRWKRLLIALAGPMVNLLLGVIIFMIFYCCAGYVTLKLQPTEEGTQLYGLSYDVGDEIVAVNGWRVYTEDEFVIYDSFMDYKADTVLTLKSAETGEKYDITLRPEFSTKARFGITRNTALNEEYNGWDVTEVDKEQNDGNPILKAGDVVLAVDGVKVSDAEKIDKYLDERDPSDVVSVTYIRDGQEYTSDIKMFPAQVINEKGIVLEKHKIRSVGEFLEAGSIAVKMPLSVIRMTGLVIKNFFKGDVEAYQVLSGPVGVVNVVDTVVADERAETGLKVTTLIFLAGMISVALTISNLLPLPGLDGSQIIILFVELISGRKLSLKVENIISVVGFFVLLFLVIAAFASDIIRIVVEGW